MEKRQSLQQILLGKMDICLEKTETRSTFVTLYKDQLKWIKDVNISSETLKLVQEKAGNTLETTGIGKDFFSRAQVALQLRQRMDKWDYMKLNSFCATK
jgi:hypothetical protein